MRKASEVEMPACWRSPQAAGSSWMAVQRFLPDDEPHVDYVPNRQYTCKDWRSHSISQLSTGLSTCIVLQFHAADKASSHADDVTYAVNNTCIECQMALAHVPCPCAHATHRTISSNTTARGVNCEKSHRTSDLHAHDSRYSRSASKLSAGTIATTHLPASSNAATYSKVRAFIEP